MVQDVFSKADVLNTTGSHGAPNFRQVKGSYPLYGMGQPSLNGFKQVLQKLQAQGHEVCLTPLLFFVFFKKNICMYTVANFSLIHLLVDSGIPVYCVPAWPPSRRLVSKYLRSQVLRGGCG